MGTLCHRGGRTGHTEVCDVDEGRVGVDLARVGALVPFVGVLDEQSPVVGRLVLQHVP